MKVSIITITFNRSTLIGETIQSVLNQTYQDFEHLIIDDGSTDGTEAVVKSFDDNRIKYFRHDHIGNISKLLNLGIQQTTGEIIAILDSDDLWTKNKLESAVAVFKSNSHIKLITHNVSYFKNINAIQKPYYTYQNDFYENAIEKVLKFKILPFPVLIFKKEIIDSSSPFNENLFDAHQDFLFAVAAKHKIYFVAEVLSLLRLHNGNTHKRKKVVLGFFLNYYKTVLKLYLKKGMPLKLVMEGYCINTKNLIFYLMQKK